MKYNQVKYWKQGEPLTVNYVDYGAAPIGSPYQVSKHYGGKGWYVYGLRKGVSARVLVPAIREVFKTKRDAMAAMQSLLVS